MGQFWEHPLCRVPCLERLIDLEISGKSCVGLLVWCEGIYYYSNLAQRYMLIHSVDIKEFGLVEWPVLELGKNSLLVQEYLMGVFFSGVLGLDFGLSDILKSGNSWKIAQYVMEWMRREYLVDGVSGILYLGLLRESLHSSSECPSFTIDKLLLPSLLGYWCSWGLVELRDGLFYLKHELL